MKDAEKIQDIQKAELIDTKEEKSKGISYDTIGTTLQALNVQLDENETIYSETGKMSWMTDNIQMTTKSRGLAKMVSRVFTGESLFINEFKSNKGPGVVTFSTDQAGKIIPLDLNESSPAIIFQRGAFLCAENGVDLSITMVKKISAGLFGGKGFVLQKVAGNGKAHLIADGEVVMYELKEGQKLLVDQGNLVAYESTVDFDIQTVSGGMFNWLFGGEGLFLGVLRGPGKVWLQTRKNNLTTAIQNGTYNAAYTKKSNNPLGCLIGILISTCFLIFTILIIILSTTN